MRFQPLLAEIWNFQQPKFPSEILSNQGQRQTIFCGGAAFKKKRMIIYEEAVLSNGCLFVIKQGPTILLWMKIKFLNQNVGKQEFRDNTASIQWSRPGLFQASSLFKILILLGGPAQSWLTGLIWLSHLTSQDYFHLTSEVCGPPLLFFCIKRKEALSHW